MPIFDFKIIFEQSAKITEYISRALKDNPLLKKLNNEKNILFFG